MRGGGGVGGGGLLTREGGGGVYDMYMYDVHGVHDRG